jgi:hypothetical protein
LFKYLLLRTTRERAENALRAAGFPRVYIFRPAYTARKQILWESEDASAVEVNLIEVEFILKLRANDPEIGYNRRPRCDLKTASGAQASEL